MENFELEFEWEWEDEVYNEETDEDELVQKYTEVFVRVFVDYGVSPSFDNPGLPSETSAEVVKWKGDELTRYEEEMVLEHAYELI